MEKIWLTSNHTQTVNRVTPFAIAKAAPRLPAGELGVINQIEKMGKRATKFPIELNEGMLAALVANTIEFKDCAGLEDTLFKQLHVDEKKIYFTEGTLKDVYTGIKRALNNDSKYPKKEGKEYSNLKKVLSVIENQYEKQTGKKIDL